MNDHAEKNEKRRFIDKGRNTDSYMLIIGEKWRKNDFCFHEQGKECMKFNCKIWNEEVQNIDK